MHPRAARSSRPPPGHASLLNEIERFDATLPIERARTPPASWYVDAAFHGLERDTVFSDHWIAVCRTAQLLYPGDHFAADVCGVPFFVLRRDDGSLSAFHNACRHHATELLTGSGCLARDGGPPTITCPYHGWAYDTDGALKTAPHMAGVEEFDRASMGLIPISLATWRGYVFLHLGGHPPPLEPLVAGLDTRLDDFSTAPLHHLATHTYTVECNWKVFVDNYLDGGYHVPILHPDLAADLELDTYSTELDGLTSIQSCAAKGDRLGSRAFYAWVHPNLMLNRYGPVLDVNRVVPRGNARTEVIFDFFFEEEALADPAFTSRCIKQSGLVQGEDILVSESVQRGLHSPSYDRGRYAPRVETAAHHFHRLIAGDLLRGCQPPHVDAARPTAPDGDTA